MEGSDGGRRITSVADDEHTLAGKLPAAVAHRSGTRPIIAVPGRSPLPQERWSEMSLSRVYALADYHRRHSPLLWFFDALTPRRNFQSEASEAATRTIPETMAHNESPLAEEKM
ncbi:hypothetical protein [Arthrobacter sp. MMS18-M83]|uniref:hypothetical protein n=1 Tax=Arthrobacter sp. MMS18-M83 TaxID=2996261 RepID=UPI00227A0CB5|nr:hypothetical protein [Arthrobacter sp. MMS18-M83]WAH95617.1 hypothetical protein OW521_14295 [Arthrobacter sp. MMS18-M83]